MRELSLAHKYLIGTDGLGSGKDRRLAEAECKKSLPCLKQILADKLVSIFIVCLGGGTGEGCIKHFLQKAVDLKVKVKLVVATLPHSSEGMEKRRNAVKLLGELEKLLTEFSLWIMMRCLAIRFLNCLKKQTKESLISRTRFQSDNKAQSDLF